MLNEFEAFIYWTQNNDSTWKLTENFDPVHIWQEEFENGTKFLCILYGLHSYDASLKTVWNTETVMLTVCVWSESVKWTVANGHNDFLVGKCFVSALCEYGVNGIISINIYLFLIILLEIHRNSKPLYTSYFSM